MERIKSTPIHKSPATVQVPLDDKSLRDEIKRVVIKWKVDSILYYSKEYGMPANCNVNYKKQDKDSIYTTYKFFMTESFNLNLLKNSFQMHYKEHEIDSNGGVNLNYLIFDDDIDEICSWKLCYSGSPISVVVYFTQIIFILFLSLFFFW